MRALQARRRAGLPERRAGGAGCAKRCEGQARRGARYRERLERLLTLGLRVPIERRFPLDKGAEAYEISRSGHARGKFVLQIS